MESEDIDHKDLDHKDINYKDVDYKDVNWLSVRQYSFINDHIKKASLNSTDFNDKLAKIDFMLRALGVVKYKVSFK